MSFHRKSLSLGMATSLAFGLLVIALIAFGSTASGDPGVSLAEADGVFKQAVATDGVMPESVHTDESANVMQVVFRASRSGMLGDAWAIMTAKREANYLAAAGVVKAVSIDVNVVDESGASVWRAVEPVEPTERPVAATPSQAVSTALIDFVRENAANAGFDLTTVSLRSDQNLGLVADINVTVSTGPTGLDAAPRAVQDVLPLALDRMIEKSIQVNMAHLSVQDVSGSILIDYVIDPMHGVVMVWGAEGVQQVWVRSRPPTPPEADTPQVP